MNDRIPMTVEELQRAVDDPPFHRLLRLKVESADPGSGTVVLRLPFRTELQRSSREHQIHGGVTGALIDIAGDYALMVTLGHGVPTINLRVDYLRMAGRTDLVATARVIKAGRSIGVVDVEVTDDEGRIVAIGRANYSTRPG